MLLPASPFRDLVNLLRLVPRITRHYVLSPEPRDSLAKGNEATRLATRASRARFIPAPPVSRAFHLQTHGDLLLTVNAPNIWVLQGYSDPNDYFKASITETFTSVVSRAKIHNSLPPWLGRFKGGMFKAALPRLTLRMMSLADFVQVKGLGLALLCSM